MARTVEAWVRRTGVRPRTRAKRAAHLEILLGTRQHRIRPLMFTRRGTTSGPGVGTWERDHVSDGLAAREWEALLGTALVCLPEDAAAEGEGPIDYWRPERLVTSPAVAQRPRVPGPWTGHPAIMARLGFRHDPSTAQPFEYAAVADRVCPSATASTSAIETGLYWGLVMLHGMGPELLQVLEAGPGPGPNGVPWLDLDTVRLWVPLPRVGYGGRIAPETEAACRPGSALASIPLSPPLWDLARRHRRTLRPGSRVFGGTLAAREQALAARLARSTPRWLVSHGMPAVLADLVAGRIRFATLATSAYVNTSEGAIARSHARATSAFWAEVLADGRHPKAVVDWAAQADTLAAGRQFGSRIVPRGEALRRAMAALAARGRPVSTGAPLAELVRMWNLAVVAAWMRLSWATALRPRRDPVVTRDRIDARRGWMLIEDKHSPSFHEVRPVPLPDGEGAHVARLVELGRRVRQRLQDSSRITAELPPERTIFFAVQGPRAVPLSPRVVRQVLEAESLAELFPWPLNACRHRWVTRALELGVVLERVEPFLGHCHDPLPWGPFATAPLALAARPVRQLGARMVRECGFDD
jgi:hypothetical protein